MRAIDADALIANQFKNDISYKAFVNLVKRQPTIDPERKTGSWIPQDMNKSYGRISTAVYYYPKCSVCGWSADNTNFCPNCGADMRGGET